MLDNSISGYSICLSSSDDISLIMQKEDISFEFLITMKMGHLFNPHQKSRLGVKLLKSISGVMLRKVVFTLLLGHLVVCIILRMQHLHSLKSKPLSKDLLLGSLLRLGTIRLYPLDGFIEHCRQMLKLKDTE